MSDDEFFQELSQAISSCEVRSLLLSNLIAASIRLAKPNSYTYFNAHSHSSTEALVNNLMILRNAERIASSDGRLSYAALVLVLVSLVVSSYDAFMR